MNLVLDIATDLMAGRVAENQQNSNRLLCDVLHEESKYHPIHTKNTSNGPGYADNVLQKKSSKIIYPVSPKAKEVVGMSCSSLPKKIKKKKRKSARAADFEGSGSNNALGGKACHMTVERKRRKVMNENLAILRSLVPCFYVKRGDQASVVGGVVDYIVELRQILRSLEAKKCRNLMLSEVFQSPRITLPSPKPPPAFSSYPHNLFTPKSTVCPGLTMPSSPATPQVQKPQTTLSSSNVRQVIKSSLATSYIKNELVARAQSGIAVVEAKFSGPNLVLKTVSRNIPGQAAKIIETLEQLSLEVLHVSINIVDQTTMLKYFKIKIGFDCQLSAEELSQRVLQTFHL